MADRAKEIAEAKRLAQRAVDLGATTPWRYWEAAIHWCLLLDVERGAAYIDPRSHSIRILLRGLGV